VTLLAVEWGGARLAVASGEAVALLGANGAGKTTLMRALIGLSPARGARVFLDGEDVSNLAPEKRARRGIGYVPEGRRVFPGMTVRDNLLVGCRAAGAERQRRLDAVETLFPALAGQRDKLGWSLSGGQQQMLAVGRALMTGPRLLLLDEPSVGLSPKLAAEVLARVATIAADGTGVLLAEQNVAAALRACRRGYVLQLGRVVREGASPELLADPLVQEAFLGGTIAP
jgi:branched-chain amino acid transport system ATP-binding protein